MKPHESPGKPKIRPKDLPKILEVPDIAQLLGVSERTVQDWCQNGLLPAQRQGPNGPWGVPLAILGRRFGEAKAAALEAQQRREVAELLPVLAKPDFWAGDPRKLENLEVPHPEH